YRLRAAARRPHAPARRPRRHRPHSQARARDRAVGTANGRGAAVVANGLRPPRLTFAVPARASGGSRRRRKRMNARQKLRAIMAGKRPVLMPGAYDALSAPIIEAQGFEALGAGGYAPLRSLLAQARMGPTHHADHSPH